MTLQGYVRALRKHWRLVTACTLTCLSVAILATLLQTPMYAARARLFVSVETPSSDTQGLAQGGVFTQQRVKSYADIVDSPQVAAAVVNALKLPMTPQQLEKSISASAPLDTVLIDVTARNESAATARDIANAVASEFGKLVNNLETPQGAKHSPVKVSVVRQAALPSAPVSPNRTLNLALGLFVGLGIGAGAAVLRESLDTSVKSAEDLADRVGVVTLGVIGHDPEAAKRPLIVQANPHSPRAEAFRQLRTNLQFLDIDTPPRSIVVTSSVPSEGKSTTTCNLAITLASAGMRVALVDGDLRRPQVAGYLGLEGAVGLTSVLIGRAELDDALQPWGQDGRLHVLAAGPAPPNPSELLGSKGMGELLHTLQDRYDLVVIDSPPLLPVTDAAVLATVASGCVLLVRWGRTRREQVSRAVEALRVVDAHLFGAVLNMVPTKGPDAYSYGYGYTKGYAHRPRDTEALPEPRAAVEPRLRREPHPASGPDAARPAETARGGAPRW